jgi:hypothetical protein
VVANGVVYVTGEYSSGYLWAFKPADWLTLTCHTVMPVLPRPDSVKPPFCAAG